MKTSTWQAGATHGKQLNSLRVVVDWIGKKFNDHLKDKTAEAYVLWGPHVK